MLTAHTVAAIVTDTAEEWKRSRYLFPGAGRKSNELLNTSVKVLEQKDATT